MPTVKKSLAMRVVLDEDQINFFLTGIDFAYFWDEPERGRDWQSIRSDILTDWIKEHPGTRPFYWWVADAPEPRLRVGGVGDLVPAYASAKNLRFGIFRKSHFVDADFLRAVAPVGDHLVPLDPEDPPRYESQAAYLKRRKLFSPGEEKRLPADAFEPEVVR